MNKICFVFDCHYPNYTKRLKSNIVKSFQELNLNSLGIGLLISTNRPQDFDNISEGIKIYDIEELRKDYPVSQEYEILPEDPTGLYPGKFPWNIERFILKKAGELGYNYVINLDSDVVFKFINSAEHLVEVLNSFYEENVVATNQALYEYVKGTNNETFHLHDQYINYFGLKYEESEFMSLDGPVLAYMGKTNEDIIRFSDIWNNFTEFGYKKEHGFGYGNIVCGNWSLTIPSSEFKLKWKDLPFVAHHNYQDRY